MTGPDGAPDGIRVVLADDHELFRRGVAEMLSFAENVEVVAEAADHEGAIAAVMEHAPDGVLLDLDHAVRNTGPIRRVSSRGGAVRDFLPSEAVDVVSSRSLEASHAVTS